MTTPLLGVAVVAFGVLALAQIAVPLTDDDATLEWLSTLVVVAFAATTLALTTGSWGRRRAGLALGFVAVGTLAVERVGHTTGFPFGEYDYAGALEPTLGGVPLIVPLAWFAMGIPALEVGHAIRGVPPGLPERRGVLAVATERAAAVVVGALALTAWDLFLDPQMVENGYWSWAVDGAYEGIPLSNYAGWLGTGVVVLAVLDRIRPGAPADLPLLALYTWWAVMSTIGFLVFFGRPLVGVVGGIGMGTCTALAWWRRRG
ncbi:MAG TPA: carotenoid biosynthesis protein [Acidimicrobiales bacterium]|nr:carotenoid biosynthesis protein [Acidimicrobiales bacterium]